VECIAKGKVHKKYEFGVKVGITVTNKSNFVLGARSFPVIPMMDTPWNLVWNKRKF
jgi:IS5 family transposase